MFAGYRRLGIAVKLNHLRCVRPDSCHRPSRKCRSQSWAQARSRPEAAQVYTRAVGAQRRGLDGSRAQLETRARDGLAASGGTDAHDNAHEILARADYLPAPRIVDRRQAVPCVASSRAASSWLRKRHPAVQGRGASMCHAPRQEVGRAAAAVRAGLCRRDRHRALLTDDRVGGCHTRRQDVSDPRDKAGNRFAFQTRGRSRPVCGPESKSRAAQSAARRCAGTAAASTRKCRHA